MDNKPVVKLISKPENMLRTIYTACRTCYSADSPINIYDKADDEEIFMAEIYKADGYEHDGLMVEDDIFYYEED